MAPAPFKLGDPARQIQPPLASVPIPAPAKPRRENLAGLLAKVVIEPGIPVPAEATGQRATSLPFARMKPGDSFFAPVEQKSLSGRANAYGRKAGLLFATRKVTERGVAGTRCWLIGPRGSET